MQVIPPALCSCGSLPSVHLPVNAESPAFLRQSNPWEELSALPYAYLNNLASCLAHSRAQYPPNGNTDIPKDTRCPQTQPHTECESLRETSPGPELPFNTPLNYRRPKLTKVFIGRNAVIPTLQWEQKKRINLDKTTQKQSDEDCSIQSFD